ncbi:hypothetical protein [Deinococcus aerophilus]|uniref:Exo-alpha-sialidase n=1 Tax=Deinococcus aerophilus TaxID=522488 RepID=A0ABQ2GPI2_9DEIO|nr:hypothetical protein [Deinococcus aerophilus]GGM05654.1 hypothetical protein GCM10010841_12510 [Deinococcus aerophilus]
MLGYRTSGWILLYCAALCGGALAGGSGEPAVLPSAPLSLRPLPAPPVPDPGRALRELRLAAAPNGALVLALLADAGQADSGKGFYESRKVTVWRLAGGMWQALGGVLNYDVPRPASTLDLALDRAGTPVVVWNENFGDNDIVVFRAFQNGAWTDWRTRYLGDDLPYAARTRSVAAQGGEPVIAWGESLRNPYGSRLTVRRWDAAARTWTRSPAFNDLTVFSRTPALTLSAAGQPTVAWLQGEVLASNVFVKRWTGTGWQALGGSLNRHPDAYVASTRLVLDARERPVVAWLEDRGGQDTLYASRWTGERWTTLGGALSTGFASAPALALDGAGRPLLAWVEERAGTGQVRLARWTGGAWQDAGVVNRDPRRDARSPALAVDPAGTATLAWREDVGGVYRVQLRRLGP